MMNRQSKLRKVLDSSSVENASGERFLTEKSIKSLITPANVVRHFKWMEDKLQSRISEHSSNTYLDVITSSAIKLFAVLLLCQKEHFIFEFLQQDLHDSCLPFTDSSDLPLKGADKESLLKSQRHVLAQVFAQGVNYDVPDGVVLPFVSEEFLGKGVERVRIYSGYARFSANSPEPPTAFANNIFARKRIELYRAPESTVRSLQDAFRRESSTLKHLLATGGHHEHIVELFSTYSMGGDHFILESCGDFSLAQLFQLSQAPGSFGNSEEAIRDVLWRSLRDLSSALDYLHNALDVVIYHHDIKPANIIVKDANLQLVDFGLSGLKSPDDTKTVLHGATYSYSPPECYTDKPGRIFGRAVDVWSLGCVFSELATLATYGFGSGGVMNFKMHRQNGPNLHHSEPDASFHNNMPEVRAWLTSLLEVSRNDQKEAIEMISKMLNIDSGKRPLISSTHKHFATLFN